MISALLFFSLMANVLVQSFNEMHMKYVLHTGAVVRSCSVKEVFLEISQNSQKNTCVRASFLIKLLAWGLKKRLWQRCFPVNFVKFLRTLFFTEHLWWLLLFITSSEWYYSWSKNTFTKFQKRFADVFQNRPS